MSAILSDGVCERLVFRALEDGPSGVKVFEALPAMGGREKGNPEGGPGSAGTQLLYFEGIATFADIYVGGAKIGEADNMFRSYLFEAAGDLIQIRVRSIENEIADCKGRPRYKTRLVQNQKLRFARTTLLGHMGGWSPPVSHAGPYRAAYRITGTSWWVHNLSIRTRIEGERGIVSFSADLGLLDAAANDLPAWRILVGAAGKEHVCELKVQRANGKVRLAGEVVIPNVIRWWPHTHGDPHTYPVTFVGGSHSFSLSPLGFRTLDAHPNPRGGFGLSINGVPVFARGVCWTPQDLARLSFTHHEVDELALFQRAGMNMVRVGGTMAYEEETFHRRADELGILVWQDLMFANMDYPFADPSFAKNVEAEVRGVLRRIANHPSTVVVCGGSEVEQQAAMLGHERTSFESGYLRTNVPKWLSETQGDMLFVPNSPSGGAMPFFTEAGVTHYYGVGAYLRPLADVRLSNIGFAAECLAFANIPDEEGLVRQFGNTPVSTHHPLWKERSPRDYGASWDFDDVRDHYLRTLYEVDPAKLRTENFARYLELSRVVTAELMARVFADLRRKGSDVRGALVWFGKDLWAGSGWGILDESGAPKAQYHKLREVLQPQSVTIVDDGLQGANVVLINEKGAAWEDELTIELYLEDRLVAKEAKKISVPARETLSMNVSEWFGRFYDVSYAYRFGPPSVDLVVAKMGAAVGTYSPFTTVRPCRADLSVRALAKRDGSIEVTSNGYLRALNVEAPGYLALRNDLDVPPGQTVHLRCVPRRDAEPRPVFRPSLHAINVSSPIRVEFSEEKKEGT
ncbi:MAG: hypothetical protein KBF88_07850 [Polyangiaceae bacterium]|nr:hypothetical protein [Polyangiaceae bacterium]